MAYVVERAEVVGACAWPEDVLNCAESLIENDPDAAALVLDGLVWRLLRAWYAARGGSPPGPAAVLADLERRAPSLAWRVRLALRAPDVAARLAHCRGLAPAFSSVRGAEASPSAAHDDEKQRFARKERGPYVR
ncbi:MAG: hypothetical protein IVW57_01430 [Ktedonobacterales bacterium]|nr:hypothetical protein [Ktedonobacterales bacterium]